MLERLYRMAGVEDGPSLIKHVLSHDAHPVIQFIKYALAGGVATATTGIVFLVSTNTIFPVVEGANKYNYTFANTLAFVISCGVAYVLNVLWVFQPGRHSRWKEIALFFGTSFIAFVVGTAIGQVMVTRFDLYGPYRFVALSATIVTSVLVNYACRKFFVFKG